MKIYTIEEIDLKATLTKFGNSKFADKPINYYNLDMIISVDYRVKSQKKIYIMRLKFINKIKKVGGTNESKKNLCKKEKRI